MNENQSLANLQKPQHHKVVRMDNEVNFSPSRTPNPKRNLLQRIFVEPDDMDLKPPPPVSQMVYGFWEAHGAPTTPVKLADIKRKPIKPARSMTNLGEAPEPCLPSQIRVKDLPSLPSASLRSRRSEDQDYTLSQVLSHARSQISSHRSNTSDIIPWESASLPLASESASISSSFHVGRTKPASDMDTTTATESDSGTIVQSNKLKKKQNTGSPSSSPKTSDLSRIQSANSTVKTVSSTKKSEKAATSQPSFELTPLSSLIKQSFKDIEDLKLAHQERVTSKDRASEDKETGGAVGTTGHTIDFDKVKENLKRFEELYRAFLRYGGAYGGKQDEVHLVAMVCKRSEVMNGKIGSGNAIPLAEKSNH